MLGGSCTRLGKTMEVIKNGSSKGHRDGGCL